MNTNQIDIDLNEVRCPFKVKQRMAGGEFTCNRLLVKVAPGSKGEAYCHTCKKYFDFEIESQLSLGYQPFDKVEIV